MLDKWIRPKECVSRVDIANDSSTLDLFQRLKCTLPFTIFESKTLYDKEPLYWDDKQVSGSGATSTFNQNSSSVTLSVNGVGKRVRQSKRWINYSPGKSQLILFTGVLGAPLLNIYKKVGIFNDSDGLFIGINSIYGLCCGRRSSVSGAVVDYCVYPNDFNLDKLDGDGSSKININLSKAQIFVINFAWLGVGKVRFGVYSPDGYIVYFHEMLHPNVIDKPFMAVPNLPIRWEIESTGAVSSNLEIICCSAISEGGPENKLIYKNYSIDRGIIPLITLLNTNTYPLISLRLKKSYLGASVVLNNFSILKTLTGAFKWSWVLNPVVSGTDFNYTNMSNSAIQYCINTTNATTISGGTQIFSGYGYLNELNYDLPKTIILGSEINGLRDEIVLCIQPLVGVVDNFYASINWFEL